ncbi:MAG: GIY-YIG nuclease family protein [Patescibacteria group bacterium]
MVEKNKILKWLEYYTQSPHKPGVYWFMNAKGGVIYVGKAKDLKNRLASYTQLTQLHGKTKLMVMEAMSLKFEVQESELVALLVEAELIRLHQPQYNILLKDDKTPLYIYVTRDIYPQVKTIRKKEVKRLMVREGLTKQDIFGPYQSAYRAKEILKMVRPIFRWCDHPMTGKQLSISAVQKEGPIVRPCFYYHIGRCSGACLGKISPQEYQKMIDQLRKFLAGKSTEVLRFFKERMRTASEDTEYELAAQYRDGIRLIEGFLKPTFKIKPDLQLPKLYESIVHEGLLHLRKEIRQFYSLSKDYPLHRIEGFDVSNIQGKNAAVSMVVFTEGKPDKANYRLFNIKSIDTPNDYHMMKEAISRRQKHPEWGQPSLILIDGGRGQLRSALSVWNWEVPVVSIVKNPDRLVIPIFEDPTQPSMTNIKYHFVHFPVDHPTLILLQQIRDESHRFAKKQHTKLRNKNIIS